MSRVTNIVSSERSRTPSFVRIASKWASTVFGLRYNSSATWRLLRPRAIATATRNSSLVNREANDELVGAMGPAIRRACAAHGSAPRRSKMRSADARRFVVAMALAEQQQAAGLFERHAQCGELLSRLPQIVGPAVQHPLASTGHRGTPLRPAQVGLRGDLGDDLGRFVDSTDREQRLHQIALVPQVAGVEHVRMQSMHTAEMIGCLDVVAGGQRHVAERREPPRLEHLHPHTAGAGDGGLRVCRGPSTCGRAQPRPWPTRLDRTTPSARRACC